MARRKDIERHLTEDELDRRINQTDDPELLRRLIFVKNLYNDDTVGEAADRVARSQPTGGRWAERWNDGGVEGLAPTWGDGRPSKLDDDDRERLRELLEAGQPWTTREVRRLIKDEFDVSYHQNYIYELLLSFDVDYAKRRPEQPNRAEDADDHLDERPNDAVDESDSEDRASDGGSDVDR